MGKIMLNGKRYCGGLVTPGQGYTEVVLWEDSSGASPSSAVTLSSAISNFDAIYIITASNAEPNYRNSQIIPISAIDKTGATNFGVFDTGANTYYYVVLNYVDDTHLTLGTWGSSYPIKYYKIVGIKYAVGGNVTQPAIYSTKEREVGVWIDGKPLYQKTVQLSNLTIPANNQVITSLSDVGILNTETVVKADGIMVLNNNPTTIPAYQVSTFSSYANSFYVNLSDGIVISRGSNSSITADYYITIQYTKTTDTAGSGLWTPQGTPAQHYATYEQVVGTWIDGSTLYEKTVSVTNPTKNSVSGYYYYNSPSDITNIDFATLINATVYDSTDGRWYDLPCMRIISSENIQMQGSVVNNSYRLQVFFQTNQTYNISKIIYTIHYTKTS